MFPSKADRILSRYRPIAPKLPLPIPPAASLTNTDLSSTCASIDSFGSSAKIRRSRKRRIAPATVSIAKCPKTRKAEQPQVVSTISNNNAGLSKSSLTQGNSDGAVPRIDFSYTSPSYAIQSSGTIATQPRKMDVSDMTRIPMVEPSMVAAPFHSHNLLEQARMFMVVDALKARQPSLSPNSLQLSGYPAGGMMEKDVAFMERAAASSVLPEKGAPSGTLSCNALCMKGPGYAGGGFTEMIRGITRLPTVADVQSLMQARSATAGAMAVTSPPVLPPTTESRHTSPTQSEAHHQRLELESPHPIQPSLSVFQMDDCTLPLLPRYPSKHALPPATVEADSPIQHGVSSAKILTDHYVCPHGIGPATHTSASSSTDKILVAPMLGSRGLCGKLGASIQSQEADKAVALSLLPPAQTANLLGAYTGPTLVRTLSRNGATMDQAYLQQVYGGSTDPILLVDVNCQALWFNKAYERASKSVLDRLSSKPAVKGPYIDPLGHPTPLGSLVLNQAGGTGKPVSATLWGFLRKLVMPEVDATPNLLGGMKLEVSRQEGHHGDTARLSLSVGSRGPPHSTSDVCSSSLPPCRMENVNDAQVCGSMGKLTTVTLESITEVHMGQGSAVECVETAEARLGAPGSVPAFITDCTSRVRWVNSAFKLMLGQSEQQSSSKGMAILATDISVMQHDPPELTFVGAAEKIPWSAWAFSGLVNLEWMKAGKRRSMTVPCDVSRLAPAATWVWKFDLALSLSLTYAYN